MKRSCFQVKPPKRMVTRSRSSAVKDRSTCRWKCSTGSFCNHAACASRSLSSATRRPISSSTCGRSVASGEFTVHLICSESPFYQVKEKRCGDVECERNNAFQPYPPCELLPSNIQRGYALWLCEPGHTRV